MPLNDSQPVSVSNLKAAIDKLNDAGSVTTDRLKDNSVTMAKLAQDVKDAMGGSSALAAYPVGAIYLSMSDTSPQTLFGGTWQKIEGKFLMFSDSSHKAGSTGGSNDAVVVSHSHSGQSDTGGSHTHSISGGSHSHTASTSSAGSHTHSLGGDVLRVSSSKTSCGTTGSNIYWYATQHYNTSSGGSHTHPVTVNSSSSHSHTMTSGGGALPQPYDRQCGTEWYGQKHACLYSCQCLEAHGVARRRHVNYVNHAHYELRPWLMRLRSINTILTINTK